MAGPDDTIQSPWIPPEIGASRISYSTLLSAIRSISGKIKILKIYAVGHP
jgi:hypothetical protein